jgi:hypothetical protein
MIMAEVSHPFVFASHEQLHLLSAARASYSSRNASLSDSQPPGGGAKCTRPNNMLAGGECREVLYSEIKANGGAHLFVGQGSQREPQGEAREPAAPHAVQCDRAHDRTGGQFPVQLHLQLTNSYECKPVIS